MTPVPKMWIQETSLGRMIQFRAPGLNFESLLLVLLVMVILKWLLCKEFELFEYIEVKIRTCPWLNWHRLIDNLTYPFYFQKSHLIQTPCRTPQYCQFITQVACKNKLHYQMDSEPASCGGEICQFHSKSNPNRLLLLWQCENDPCGFTLFQISMVVSTAFVSILLIFYWNLW